jgi:polysaccharide deacetylase family protein (PEP-CTERM system associated)
MSVDISQDNNHCCSPDTLNPVECEQLNALSVDVEEYFQVSAFTSRISPTDWDTLSPRVEGNVHRILELFGKHNVHATFFILGWIARKYPHLVREIAVAGHEIGSHGFSHQRIQFQTPDEFRTDIRESREALLDQAQKSIACYRAPSFSIVGKTLWALDILIDEGFKIDSSIFPVVHDLYGIPNAKRYPHWHESIKGRRIFEFPPSTIRLAGNNWAVGGGGYLRILPYGFTRWALSRINVIDKQPGMVYFHPWEIDPAQPRISAPILSKFRHYTNLSSMELRIIRLLSEFKFATISKVCSQLRVFKTHKN